MKKSDYEVGKGIIGMIKEKRDKLNETIKLLEEWIEENKFEPE